jgi:hypothetical protein
MRIFTYALGGFLLGVLLALVISTVFAADTIRACTGTDGTVTFTNVGEPTCPVVALPGLTVAPTRSYLTLARPADVSINNTETETVNDQMCTLYKEWMVLTSRTLGGFAHNTVADTQRRLVLVQLFGGGFAPTSCH